MHLPAKIFMPWLAVSLRPLASQIEGLGEKGEPVLSSSLLTQNQMRLFLAMYANAHNWYAAPEKIRL
jgi:hypothetical protein